MLIHVQCIFRVLSLKCSPIFVSEEATLIIVKNICSLMNQLAGLNL